MIIAGVILTVLMLGVVIWMLLTRKLREKYAVFWIVIGLAVLLIGLFPQVLGWLTDALGVVLPANLLFSMAIVLLMAVALHLSWELSQAEEEIRRAAEDIAILRSDVSELTERLALLEDSAARPTAPAVPPLPPLPPAPTND